MFYVSAVSPGGLVANLAQECLNHEDTEESDTNAAYTVTPPQRQSTVTRDWAKAWQENIQVAVVRDRHHQYEPR